jgi:hypothetical protein
VPYLPSRTFAEPLGKSRCAALAIFLSASSYEGAAHAKPWLEGRGGLGVTSGHFEFEKEYFDSQLGQEVIAHDEGGPFGVAIALGAVAGWAVNERAALGLTGRIELAPYVENVQPRFSTVDSHLLTAIGSTFAYRPARAFELRVAPEWAFASFTGSTLGIGADDNIYEHETVNGPGLGFALGYCSAPGWGFSGATNVALLSSEHTKLTLLTFTLLANWSSW